MSSFDAAKVDGASGWWIYRSVMVPLSLPALGAIAIILFLATWNSYFWPLIVATDIEVLTIPLGLVYLIDITIANSIGLQWEKAMVVATISILPLLLTFLLAQRQFIAGLTLRRREGHLRDSSGDLDPINAYIGRP